MKLRRICAQAWHC